MNLDRRPDLNGGPANDNRTVDLPNLFDRSYRRPSGEPLNLRMRRRLILVAALLIGLFILVGMSLALSRLVGA